MKIALKWKLFFVLGAISLISFTSCSDDDDAPKAPAVTDVNGSYAGKVYYESLAVNPQNESVTETPETPSVAIEATVNNDTISINKFPVEALVKTIITDETQAQELIDKIGDISYKIGFNAALNAAQDSITLTLDPKPLEFSIPLTEENSMDIRVEIAVTEQGVYAIKEKNLQYGLKATVPGLFEAGFGLSFKLDKK